VWSRIPPYQQIPWMACPIQGSHQAPPSADRVDPRIELNSSDTNFVEGGTVHYGWALVQWQADGCCAYGINKVPSVTGSIKSESAFGIYYICPVERRIGA